MSTHLLSGQRPHHAVILLLLLCASTTLRAQSGEFEYYFFNKDGKTEEHSIFMPGSNVNERLEGHGEIAHTFHFQSPYDSLFKQFPEEFQWEVSSLPDGASFDSGKRYLYWSMRADQLKDYLIKIYVRYRDVRDSAIVAVRVEEKWKSSMIPGANYAVFMPYNPTAYGTFNGVSVEYLVIAWVSRNNNRGPSHGKIYVRFDLMQSSDPNVTAGLFYTTGLSLSLERNPRRLFGIPYFGFEMGGMYNAQWGNIFQFTPIAGVWLYADQTNTISLTGGYLVPGEQFETLRGWRASIGGTFSLW